jgi:hypothetical protein
MRLRRRLRTAGFSALVGLSAGLFLSVGAAPAAARRHSSPRLLETAGMFAVRPGFMAFEPPGAATVMEYILGPHEPLRAYGHQGAGIHWTVWTRREAIGVGTMYGNQCDPTCFSNNFVPYTVVLQASRVRLGRFTRLLLTYRWPGHVRQSPMRLGIQRVGTLRVYNWFSP